jgi:hypothetical protein
MAYSYRGTGYLSNAVTTDTGRKVYLFKSGGYQGSSTEIGYDNFGTRVLNDGATIESYSCVAEEIRTSPTQAGDALTSVTLTEGTIIFGKFDSVAVASGKVLAYKAIL